MSQKKKKKCIEGREERKLERAKRPRGLKPDVLRPQVGVRDTRNKLAEETG